MNVPAHIPKPTDWDSWTFSQKVRWRCQNPDPRIDYRVWADKHLVKDVVRPWFNVARTYFVTNNPDDIDADRLPSTYVMKATHGWDMSLLVTDGIAQGGNRNIVFKGRRADSGILQSVARTWFESPGERLRRAHERHYEFVQYGILFEQFLDPIDYELQLFLFGGRYRLAMVFYRDFFHRGTTHRLYDENWRELGPATPEAEGNYERAAPDTPRPPAELLEKLEELCRGIDHVRADFYACGSEYYFSEFTFTHNLGGPGFIGRYDAGLGRHWLA